MACSISCLLVLIVFVSRFLCFCLFLLACLVFFGALSMVFCGCLSGFFWFVVVLMDLVCWLDPTILCDGFVSCIRFCDDSLSFV